MEFPPKAELEIQLGDTVGSFTLKRKTFSTGSDGYHAQGKLTLEDENGDEARYQCNFLMTRIGSKPN